MKHAPARTAAAFLLLAGIILYRVAAGYAGGACPWLPNFAPVAAIALCGGIYLPGRLALGLPLAGLLVSDLILNAHYHAPLLDLGLLPRYGALGLIALLGWSMAGRARLGRVLLASLAGSLLFYLVTNTGCWMDDPGYAKTLAGWVQALTTGLPGYPPTWMFFRSTLLSDLLFTGLFLLCMQVTQPAEETPDEEPAAEPEDAPPRPA